MELQKFEVLANLMTEMVEVNKDTTKKLIKRVDLIEKDINYLKVHNEELELQVKEQSIKINDTNHTATNALEKISLRDENYFGNDWASQTDLGLLYEPTISSHQIGWILKEVGLAKKNSRKTTPLRTAHSNGWVRRGFANNYTSWFWYISVFQEKFKDYLKLKGLYQEFLEITTNDDMEEFIKNNFNKRNW